MFITTNILKISRRTRNVICVCYCFTENHIVTIARYIIHDSSIQSIYRTWSIFNIFIVNRIEKNGANKKRAAQADRWKVKDQTDVSLLDYVEEEALLLMPISLSHKCLMFHFTYSVSFVHSCRINIASTYSSSIKYRSHGWINKNRDIANTARYEILAIIIILIIKSHETGKYLSS